MTADLPMAADRIAVTVIGGYLGSGKTTLLNHLLRTGDERIAVLVNDFGDINIDADLIERQGDSTLELANGCICCSLVDGFAAALDTILELDPRPARLVIEASGVSDPAQVAAWGHGRGFLLDAVVVMVDSETIRKMVTDRYVGQTVTQQMRAAQIIIANKTDLVDADELAGVVEWLQADHPDAVVHAATNAEVPGELLFGRPSSAPTGDGEHIHAEDIFETWTHEASEPTTREAIDEMMAGLDDRVVRAKGFVWLEDSDQPAVLQRVGRRHTLRRLGTWPAEPATRIVFIATKP